MDLKVAKMVKSMVNTFCEYFQSVTLMWVLRVNLLAIYEYSSTNVSSKMLSPVAWGTGLTVLQFFVINRSDFKSSFFEAKVSSHLRLLMECWYQMTEVALQSILLWTNFQLPSYEHHINSNELLNVKKILNRKSKKWQRQETMLTLWWSYREWSLKVKSKK